MSNSTPPAGDTTPPTRALVFIGVGAGLIVTLTLGLYALTPGDARPELLTRLSTVAPSLVVLVPAVLAWLNGREAAAKAKELDAKVDVIADNVNGRFSAVIEKLPDPDDREAERDAHERRMNGEG